MKNSVSGLEPPGGQGTLGTSPSEADRALLLATAAWSEKCRRPIDERAPGDAARDFIMRIRERLAPATFGPLMSDLGHAVTRAGSSDSASALERLRTMHQATARVDLARVHPSWWIRALQEESPAVQRVVVASVAESLRFRLQAGLLLDSRDLLSERAAAPEVASWVLSLWNERLVGGEAERADDSPAIIMLSRLSPRAGYRLCRQAGLCKLFLAETKKGGQAHATLRPRLDWLKGPLAAADLDTRICARGDVESSQVSRLPPRQRMARIGLTTVARLLAAAEPFRLRWALQHWPYPIAKLVRSLLPADADRTPALLEAETLILKTAWDRLNLEGRVPLTWPLSPEVEPRSHPS
jgi:hypothetical protein